MDQQVTEVEGLDEGQVISNRYKIERELGAGGMGAVYLASDLLLEGSTVALKVLHKSLQEENPEFTKRFLREVQIMHRVNHKNVVRTYDVGQCGDFTYFTMEFIEGEALEDLLDREGQLPFDQLIDVAEQTCRGLQAIHDCDIVHRDLKPANILMLKDGTVKITDFGVARPNTSNLTQHDGVFGTVAYMAPEVMLGKEVTSAIDFYSYGIILYELVTGRVPFEADVMAAQMMMHVKRTARPPIEYRPDMPEWLNQLIIRLLAKAPGERPRATEILEVIQSAQSGRVNVSEIERTLDKARAQSTTNYQFSGSAPRPASSHAPRSSVRRSRSSTSGSGSSRKRRGTLHGSSQNTVYNTRAVYQRQAERSEMKNQIKKYMPLIVIGTVLLMWLLVVMISTMFSTGTSAVFWFKDLVEAAAGR